MGKKADLSRYKQERQVWTSVLTNNGGRLEVANLRTAYALRKKLNTYRKLYRDAYHEENLAKGLFGECEYDKYVVTIEPPGKENPEDPREIVFREAAPAGTFKTLEGEEVKLGEGEPLPDPTDPLLDEARDLKKELGLDD